MRVSCLACNAELSLDVLLANEDARAAMARLAQASVPLGSLVLRYLALFRPVKRRLSIDRMTALLLELLPDIERKAVTRKGREWDADLECWRAALETMLAYRDAGKLTLPLASHAYLHEVIVGFSEKIEAQAERDREAQRRATRPVMVDADGAVHVEHALAPPRIGVSAPAAPAGPSRHALKVRAEIEARKARREEGADDGEQD
jgi:hypothetical protein